MGKNEEERRMDRYKKILEKSKTVLGKEIPKSGKGLEASVRYVLGPALNSFVLWILSESRRKGIQRLYFLSRDGYFMYHCAKSFCEKWKLEIECRYLSCSRYSVRIPVFQFDTEKALDYICRGSIELTADKILSRAGLSTGEKQEVLEELPLLKREKEIPYAELGKIKDLLRNSPFFLECMEQHSKEEYPKLKNYLIQEGLLEEKSMAFVDSGWVGSMQMVLNQILEKEGKKEKLPGYYWGLYEIPKEERRENYFCYYFSPEKGLREKVFFSNNLFEVLFSAPHGTTVGYERRGNCFLPIYGTLEEGKKDFMNQLGVYLEEYTKGLQKQILMRKELDIQKQRKTVKKLLKLFMGNPTKMEAERFGRLIFSDDVTDNGHREVAVKMTKREICQNHIGKKAAVMLGWKKGDLKESAWYEGSVTRYGCGKRYHLFLYRLYKYLLYMRQKYYYVRSREKRNAKRR